MSRRYRDEFFDSVTFVRSTLAHGLRSRLKEGYGRADLRADVLAGLVVGVVALPLSMALGIASGATPQSGLYTAIVAGAVCALLGGTRTQVTGPTAAFVALLVPVVTRFGIAGLLLAGFMAGAIQLAMGLARMGRLIAFVPHPVTTGFTAGIAVVIATLQLKDVFGLSLPQAPESYVQRWQMFWSARHTASAWEALTAAVTLGLLVLVPRFIKRVPAPLIALTLVSLLVAALERWVPGFEVATIASRFQTELGGQVVAGIPPVPPMPILPWTLPGPGGAPLALDFATLQALLPSALAIAMLGAIESLLAAVIADGLSGTRHDPNAELMALGIGNMLCPFFGGIAATGALARTATNIRAGARSPLAAVFHALFILASTVALAPLVSYLPMAALAALLLLVARNMAELDHFAHLLRVAPRSDTLVLLVCFLLTVLFDMVVAVGVGVVLAALLFMKRMAEITNVRLDTGTMVKMELPPEVLLYEIAGPLFFGAAQKAMSTLESVHRSPTAVILYMAQVPVMDATGLVALETLLAKLKRSGHKVVLTGLNGVVKGMLDRAGIVREPGRLAFAPDLETAVSIAIVHHARRPTPLEPGPAGETT
jgi:sulfate permease, SulP family